MRARTNGLITQNNVFAWIALATGTVLLVPLIAMQFTDEVHWTLFDFVVAGVLLFGTGAVFVLAARRFPKNRLIVAGIVVLALMYIWVELAVGLFTNLGS